jgi:hypothetical protein
VIFALDMEDGTVIVFDSEEEAGARCKPVDVEDGFWRFYDEDGSPLDARFFRPGGPQLAPASYSLSRAMSGLWLQERLGQVKRVEGLDDVAELEETLRVNRGKRIALDRLAPRHDGPASRMPDE